MKPSYTILAERDGTWWSIRVRELPGVFSQARRLDGVEAMARDAIALFLDIGPDSFELNVVPVLSAPAEEAVALARGARSAALEQQRVASQRSRDAVRVLAELGMAIDIGRILGLSHQRVAQLLEARPRRPRELRCHRRTVRERS